MGGEKGIGSSAQRRETFAALLAVKRLSRLFHFAKLAVDQLE